MTTKTVFLTSSVIALLAACGGGGTGATDANGIQTGPLTGAEIEATLDGVLNATGDGVSVDELVSIGDAAAAVEPEGLTQRDLTAAGSASYTGIVLLSDFDTSGIIDLTNVDDPQEDIFDEDTPDPTFAMLGRSELRVTFGADPNVSGGANGFIGLNFETLADMDVEALAELGDDPDIDAIVEALPTVNVPGALTYSGGAIVDTDTETDLPEDLALTFDVDGSLTLTGALTGNSNSQTLTVDGSGVAAMSDTLGIGLLDLGSTGGANDIPIGGVVIGVAD